MTPLIIIGAGGHGAEVAAYARDLELPLLGVVDDGKPRGSWHITQILGGMNDLPALCRDHAEIHYITALGDNGTRRQLVKRLECLNLPNLRPFTVHHRAAWIGAGVQLGAGTLLAPNALVTTRSIIGDHCILNIKASVSHDSIVGDFCNINPGATLCGDVVVSEGCYIGAGATVLEKRNIGAWTIVGAGAVVTQDLPAGVTAVGVPARIIRRQGIPRLS
jgi:acetyltransferase EpsM